MFDTHEISVGPSYGEGAIDVRSRTISSSSGGCSCRSVTSAVPTVLAKQLLCSGGELRDLEEVDGLSYRYVDVSVLRLVVWLAPASLPAVCFR